MPFSPGQSWRLRKPAHVMDDGGFAGPGTPVTAVDASVLAEGGIFEIIGFLFIHEECDVRAQRALIGLQGEDVIGASIDHLAGDLALAAHGVDGDDRAFNDQHVQKLGDGNDLIGFLGHLDLAEHQSLARREGRDDVDRRVALFGKRAAAGLAVDGNHLGGDAGLSRHPSHEALLEPLGVEGREYLPQPVMGRRFPQKRPEPAQQIKLVFPEPRDVGEGLGPRQHRQER